MCALIQADVTKRCTELDSSPVDPTESRRYRSAKGESGAKVLVQFLRGKNEERKFYRGDLKLSLVQHGRKVVWFSPCHDILVHHHPRSQNEDGSCVRCSVALCATPRMWSLVQAWGACHAADKAELWYVILCWLIVCSSRRGNERPGTEVILSDSPYVVEFFAPVRLWRDLAVVSILETEETTSSTCLERAGGRQRGRAVSTCTPGKPEPFAASSLVPPARRCSVLLKTWNSSKQTRANHKRDQHSLHYTPLRSTPLHSTPRHSTTRHFTTQQNDARQHNTHVVCKDYSSFSSPPVRSCVATAAGAHQPVTRPHTYTRGCL